MSEHSAAVLLALAKKQLGLRASTSVSNRRGQGLRHGHSASKDDSMTDVFFPTKDSRVPDFYLEELRTHLKLFPLEDNVRVDLRHSVVVA